MTLFEKIAARQIPADIIHEDHLCLAFHDIAPQAPVHFLVVHKSPIPRIALASPDHTPLLGHLLATAATIARSLNLDHSGFRIVINNGPDAGEAVPHLHLHVLAGRPMTWPPG